MTEHTCENCYYRYFDSKVYPCSMCVCGEERKDMFKPKIAEQTEEFVEPNIYDPALWE